MKKQPEALRLAQDINLRVRYGHETEDQAKRRHQEHDRQAAAELRRLHESNTELREALRDLMADNSDLSMTQHLALYRKARAAINKAERTTT